MVYYPLFGHPFISSALCSMRFYPHVSFYPVQIFEFYKPNENNLKWNLAIQLEKPKVRCKAPHKAVAFEGEAAHFHVRIK